MTLLALLSRNSRCVFRRVHSSWDYSCRPDRPVSSLGQQWAGEDRSGGSGSGVVQPAVLHRPSRTARGTHHPLRAVSLPAADVLTAVRGRAPASASGRTTSGSTRDATAATGFVQSRPAKSVKIVDKSQRSGRFAPAQQTQSLLKPAWQSQAAQHAQAVAERQEVYREEGRRRMEPLQVGTKHASPSSSGHALDLAEYLSAYDQLPGWDTVQREDALYFDWSGQTDYTPVRKQLEAPYWGVDKMNDRMEAVAIHRHGKDLSVMPLWIAVHQTEKGGLARLYRSTIPLTDAIVRELRKPVEHLLICDVEEMVFDKPDVASGPWRNYCTGIIGPVAHKEEDVLWPNQVLHGNRTMYNLRNGYDLARFLARPDQQNLEQHQQNLRRIAQERHYKPGWSWFVMKDRWGEASLRYFKIDFSS